MSYTGSDDQAICDGCFVMYPPGWPNWITPWPATGPVLVDGRMSADHRDNFNLCLSCLRQMVLKARLPLDGRETALASRARWEASRRLLDQAETVIKGPRPTGRIR